MIDNLLKSLTNLILLKNESNGYLNINDAKKSFIKYLSDFIDYRIKVDRDINRKNHSKDRIFAADSINSNLKSTASTIKSMSALSKAPAPPNDNDDIKLWLEEYTKWYNGKRSEGMDIK